MRVRVERLDVGKPRDAVLLEPIVQIAVVKLGPHVSATKGLSEPKAESGGFEALHD